MPFAGLCFNWQGAKNSKGYPVVWMDGKRQYASRVIYRIAYGPFDEGLDVCHRCDNPACVRPEHLFLGTAKDNVRDAIAKGRWKNPPSRLGARRALCPKGHAKTEGKGRAFCRECERESSRKYRARKVNG